MSPDCIRLGHSTKAGPGRGPSLFFQHLRSVNHPAGGMWLRESCAPCSGTSEFADSTAVRDSQVALEFHQLLALGLALSDLLPMLS